MIENASKLSYQSQNQEQVEKGTPNFNVPDGGYDGSKVTIKFYHTMGSNLSDVLDLYIPEFNKLYPNITVEWSQIGNYDDVRNQVSTEITVGDQPNIAYCYPDHVALYNLAGAVATLDNLIDSKIPVSRADGSTEIIGSIYCVVVVFRTDFVWSRVVDRIDSRLGSVVARFCSVKIVVIVAGS